MPHPYPPGEPVPDDGSLPTAAAAEVGRQPFGAYVHVPFCATRCGYCDFNTYTADQLEGSSTQAYVEATLAEIEMASRVMVDAAPLSTVFFGGGTPTLLHPDQSLSLLSALRDAFGFASDVEVTSEANPESVTPESLTALREGGFNRISFGMQSAVPRVLATLDRTHTPGRVGDAMVAARAAGFGNVSLDLIYGAPGESFADWRQSLEMAIALDPDHISAYALIVEDGTRLAGQVKRGELVAPDDDEQATKYELADELLTAAGYDWYEVSNWARDGKVSRHNMGYWLSHDWWGFGPGAHSHVAGVRWWNVKHPRAYAAALSEARTPAVGREVLDDVTQQIERILLRVRLQQGLESSELDATRESVVDNLIGDGLVEPQAWRTGHVVLTLRGRLLADRVVDQLTEP